MLDLVVLGALATAFVTAARLRGAALLALTTACAYLVALDVAGALGVWGFRPLNPLYVVGLVFVGPTVVAERVPPAWMAPAFLAELTSSMLRFAILVVAGAAVRLTDRESAALRPEDTRARRLDRVHVAFVVIAVFRVLPMILDVLASFLVR